MKKFLIFISIVLFTFLCGFLVYHMENYEEIYYTKIDNSKIKELDTGDMKYEYTLPSYNKNGRKKELKFKTSRVLKNEAFLLVEVRTFGVHKWEEVTLEELPEKVKEKLK